MPSHRFSRNYHQYTANRKIFPQLPSHLHPDGTGLGSEDYTGELPDLKNIQGDVFMQFPKAAENFMFFVITDAAQFKKDLSLYKPTSSYDVLHHLHDISNAKHKALETGTASLVDLASHQIAFTRAGLNFLGLKEETKDQWFDHGSMAKDRNVFADHGVWEPCFSAGALHGVFIIAASDRTICNAETDELKQKFKSSVSDTIVMDGNVRPPPYKGFEHFGYKDGVSQPALRGLSHPHKGQLQVDPGVIIMGYQGDSIFDNTDLPDDQKRPAWTKDGSLMVFRKLEQDVIGFAQYLKKNGPKWHEFSPPVVVDKPLSDSEGAELFGARLLGRWKSGTSLAMAPYRDDPKIASDIEKINDFDYTIAGKTRPTDLRCPFTAHARKTWPRNLDPYIQQKFIESSAIVRAGIPYGAEVSESEVRRYDTAGSDSQKPEEIRGLLFACYQSSLDQRGFMLQVKGFADNEYFPITDIAPRRVGQDSILGGPWGTPPLVKKLSGDIPSEGEVLFVLDNGDKGPVQINGFAKPWNQSIQAVEDNQEFFITSRGGEYFFVPSVSTLHSLYQ